MPKRSDIPPEQWDHATDLFELGFKNGRELAIYFGVSPQTVMREMKRRGAIKGRRSRETVADLEASLDRKALRRAHAKAKEEIVLARRLADSQAIINHLMEAIVQADELGDLSLANGAVAGAASAFGVRTSRR